MATLGSQEQERDDREREKHATGPGGEKELAPLAVNQHDPHECHQKLRAGKKDITPVSSNVREAALHREVSVVSRDGVDSGGDIAKQDRA
jgi:hypothetical protein